jgi:hypothetical protein
MPVQAPPPWLMFVIMACLVSAFLALVVILGGLLRVARGESFWPHEDGELAPAVHKVRSAPFKKQFNRANGVQGRSPRANAEKENVQTVQTFTDRSNVQNETPPIMGDLPETLDELQRLAHAIALYAKRPNKELAILESWGESKGEGEGYQRASRLFDAAMSDAARAAAKAKVAHATPEPIKELA